MSAILEIKSDSPEQVAAQVQDSLASESAAEVTLQDLPTYLQEPEKQNSMALSVVAVLFFLLSTAGPVAAMKFYLQPNLVQAEDERASAEADLRRVDQEVETEKRRGEEHEKKLQSIEKQLLSPSADRDIDGVVVGVHAIATAVAGGRATEGGFVMISNLTISEKGDVNLSGAVDSYLTLADWLEQLEASPFLSNVVFAGATGPTDETKPSVPFSLKMRLEAPKKPAPSSAPASVPPTTPPTTPPSVSSPTPLT